MSCSELDTPPLGPGDLSVAASQHASTEGPDVTLNQRFLRIARETPGGFAGGFIDDGVAVVLMQQPAEAAPVVDRVGQAFPRILEDRPVEVREAEFDFEQLMEWYGVFREIVFEENGVWSGIKESRNQLRGGLLSAADIEGRGSGSWRPASRSGPSSWRSADSSGPKNRWVARSVRSSEELTSSALIAST